ncbi:hypothetical protein OH809_45270 (plasmid) [Streptomyces sp. NBC_00873]|uniref:hypothetical protein n=1 Tax=Streptomyces sp. NBC_00873 TaxID=2975852 RepID=UPI0037DC6ADE|nr:hypothetical protein OH809_45270 [Streptomyces sp. NBC_00873]
MTSKKRNTSSRTAKLRRQAKARAERSTRTAPDWAPLPAALEAFEQACAIGYLRVRRPDGQIEELTLTRIRDYLNAAYAASDESPLEPGELADLLSADLRDGEMAMWTDGLWSVNEDYFATPEAQP